MINGYSVLNGANENLYIVYEMKSLPYYPDNGSTLRNSLFGVLSWLNMRIVISILILDMVFHVNHIRGTFSISNDGFGKNVLMFGVWAHLFMLIIDKRDILILGKGPTQGWDGTTSSVEAKFSISFTEQWKKFNRSNR